MNYDDTDAYNTTPEPVDDGTQAIADEPPGAGDDWQTKYKELETKFNNLSTGLTNRLNTLNTTVANNKTELTTKIGTVEGTANSAKTQADNNKSSIDAFQGSLDTLTHQVGDAVAATTLVVQRLDNVESWQSAINTGLVKGVQQAKDFAREVGTSARTYTDQTAAALRNQAKQDKDELGTAIGNLTESHEELETAYRGHAHTVAVTGEFTTGRPDEERR
ncbi:hypothetical protein [Saccharothrix sp. HUAS TT1]|uniref:hypothetical protein n=1 Tax=unclassified Saccharothrix TaxID=2593673 RepID=UPI00345B9E6B